MMRVLKDEASVSGPTLRTSTADGRAIVTIAYQAAEGARWATPTTFTLIQGHNGKFVASTTLPGLYTPGKKLDLHATDIVAKAWKEQCSVPVIVMTL